MKLVKIPFSGGGLGHGNGANLAPDKIVEKLKDCFTNESGFTPKFKVENLQLDESNITFHFSEGRWLKTQVYTTEWPDLTKILDNPAQPVPCGTDFYDNCEQLIPFTDEHDAVYFNGEELSTSKHDEQGARFATEDIPVEGAFNLTQLLKLKGVAKTIDFSLYPAPVLFFGDNIRGAIIGQRV